MLESKLRETLSMNHFAGVLQLNCKHSKYVTHSLFNSDLTSLFTIISLQEPYVNPIDNLPLNFTNWTLVCPAPPTLSEGDRPRACLYIRRDLDPIINPIHSPSQNLAACTVSLRDYTILVASVYNPQTTLDGFEAFTKMLQTSPLTTQLLSTLCTTDANLHSPLWNPSHSKTHDKDADTLLDMLTDWGLILRSPKGIPTFGVRSAHTEGTSIDQVWVNEEFDDATISCTIDEDDVVSHQSDHQAILTIFSTEATATNTTVHQSSRKKNWNKVNGELLKSELTSTLPPIHPLTTQEEVETFDNLLRKAIVDGLNNNSPNEAPHGKHKKWWRPEVLDPLRKEATRLRRRAKKSGTPESQVAYKNARNTFNRAIDKAKEDSWRQYLSNIDHTNLFQAKRIATGRQASSLVSTIITAEGKTCATNEEKAEALFSATCIATTPCRLNNTNNLTFPLTDRPSEERTLTLLSVITTESLQATIDDLPPKKAPGGDGIQNWIWKLVWDKVKSHVKFLFQCITITGIIPQAWKQAVTVMIPKPGKPDYTQASAYRPIALLITLSKVYEKLVTTHLSGYAEKLGLLHGGHYGGRPNRSSQEALVHLVTWIKREWSKGKVVGALFADVNSAFPSVHHPRLLDTLEKRGINTQTLNIVHDFLTSRSTTLTFNGFESQSFPLDHDLPQGSPLSPLLYLLYNSSLLEVTDSIPTATALGFVDDVVLLSSANDTHLLGSQMRTLSFRQQQWAKDHGAIFDAKKTFWVLFSLQDHEVLPTIDFANRKQIRPSPSARWLGITIDNKLSVKQHRLEVLAKGRQRAGFLAGLSKASWGIPPKLFRTLMTTTIHATTDYGAMAWLPAEPPKFFTDQLTIIDNLGAKAALGALSTTPAVFLRHDLNLPPPKARLQSKILSFMARSLAKPASHPFFQLIQQAQRAHPKSHRNPFHQFFQHPLHREFEEFVTQIPVDPASTLVRPTNLSTIIQLNKSIAKSNTLALKPSPHHLLVFSDGSRIPEKTTAAASWCANTNTSKSEQLGPARSQGIYLAEYQGVQLGLRLAQENTTTTTRRATIVLDNQGVVKDLRSNSSSISSLDNRHQTYKMLRCLQQSHPSMNVTVRWCPGHQDIPGNTKADKIANSLAKQELPANFPNSPNTAAFLAAIKEWRTTQTEHFDDKDRKRLGHPPQPQRHLKALGHLLKHEVAAITQLRSGHAPLNAHLSRFKQLLDPVCDCQEGIETTDHFLFICQNHDQPREKLEYAFHKHSIAMSKKILSDPSCFRLVADYCNSTWRFANQWRWAKTTDQPLPQAKSLPID